MNGAGLSYSTAHQSFDPAQSEELSYLIDIDVHGKERPTINHSRTVATGFQLEPNRWCCDRPRSYGREDLDRLVDRVNTLVFREPRDQSIRIKQFCANSTEHRFGLLGSRAIIIGGNHHGGSD